MLNKAKKFRQMDLKKSVVKRAVLSPEEMAELQRQAEEERRRWLEVREAEKMRRQEERLERLRKAQQQRRLERLRQREMLRPREDTLCADGKVSCLSLCVPWNGVLISLSLSLSLCHSQPQSAPCCLQSCLERL